MKSTFFRKTATSVCIAALLSYAPAAFAADSESSIEINLDVLSHPSKQAAPATEAIKPAEPKETPQKIAKPKTSKAKAAPKTAPKAASAPTKPHAEKTTKPKHEAKAAPAKPVAKSSPLAVAPAPAPVSNVPTIESKTPVLPAELPTGKGLPPELTPSQTSNLPVVPAEAPKTETPKAEAPKTEILKAETPKAETPKPGLGDQLSDFVNGKPTPPATPVAPTPPAGNTPSANMPATPAAPMSETPPAAPATAPLPANNLPSPPELPAVISPAPPAGTAPATPATPSAPAATLPEPAPATPTAMGSPLPDSKLEPLPATPPATAPAALPTAPKDTGMNIEAVPALPTAIAPAPPVTPNAAVGTVTPPTLPLPEKGGADSGLPSPPPPLPGGPPAASDSSKPALPPLGAITGDDSKPPAELPKTNEPQLPAKTADVPDLAPVPDMKGDLPSLPSGRQQDLMDTSHTPAPSSASGSGSAELETKANASDPDERLVFNETETDVPASLNGQLDTLAQKLAQTPNAHVNIYAYAGNKSETGIYPKRVSLARGIAVRNYLTTNKGIDIERVNVRALGNKSEGGPAERVDLFITK